MTTAAATPTEPVPFREVALGSREVEVDRRADGTIHVRSPHRLGAYPDRLTDRLIAWANERPDTVFLAARTEGGDNGGGWRTFTYAETLAAVRRIGTALIARDLSHERPIVILSGNDMEHALLGLAAQYAGIPYAPISPAYSLVSTDHAKLRYIVDLLTPGLIFAADGAAFAPAIDAVRPDDCAVVVTRNPQGRPNESLFGTLLDAKADATVDAAQAAVTPDTIAKLMFTSGSTGMPKGVINTQRMLCSNQEMIAWAFAYFRDEPPVLLDWAPWNHTAGGNHNFGIALYNGGTFHIDDGNPTPAGIGRTVRNLRDVSPTWYFNVPKGYEALLPHLRADRALRETFFRNLKVLFYAGAGMAQHIWDELDALAVETCGARILRLCGFGATETGPFALILLWDAPAGHLGIPAPDVDIKLVPNGGKLEARIKSPGVMPGYWRQPELTAEAFDGEGYYMLGDAMTFADPGDARAGLLFDGRVKEDFKLDTGTWVNVGPLRGAFIDHFAPYVSDVVIAGLNRDFVSALVFVDANNCRRLTGQGETVPLADVVNHPAVRKAFHDRLRGFAGKSTGSSNRVVRLMLQDDPPSIDRHEMTDKGSLNQRAVLDNRAALVEALYAEPPDNRVLTLDREP